MVDREFTLQPESVFDIMAKVVATLKMIDMKSC